MTQAAQAKTGLFFNVTNGPGLYKLLKEYMLMLDEHKKPIVQLTLQPLDEGEELIGHGERLRAFFEVALLGPTFGRTFGSKGVRLLGRFAEYPNPRFYSWGIIKEFAEWQWEVVLESDRQGFVRKLDQLLPEELTR